MVVSSPATTSSAPDAPHPSTGKLLLRRLGIAIALLLVLLIPAIIMVAVIYAATGRVEAAGSWAAMPAIAGIAAVVAGSVELGVSVAIVLGLLAPLAIVAGATPTTGAALMALMCLMVGRMSRFGLQKATLLVPVLIAWALISPPAWGASNTLDRTDNVYLLWTAAIWFVGGIFPVIVLPLAIRKLRGPRPTPAPHPRREAIPYTLMITILSTVGTYYVLEHAKEFAGAFLIAAIMVLAPIGESMPIKQTAQRLGGTILGSAFVLVIVTQVHSLGLVYLIGLVLGVAAIVSRLSAKPTIYYVLMVPTAACLNAYTIPEVGELGFQRVVDNVVGGVLVLLAVAISLGFSRWHAQHSQT